MKLTLALITIAAMLLWLTVCLVLAQTDYDNGYYRGLDDTASHHLSLPNKLAPAISRVTTLAPSLARWNARMTTTISHLHTVR